jgi:hypothetical protein
MTETSILKIAPMRFQFGFRIISAALASILGWFSLTTIFAESLTPQPPALSNGIPTEIDRPSNRALAHWAAASAPLRGDLLANLALADAGPTLKRSMSTKPATVSTADDEDVATLARQSLSFTPYASRMWLLLAMTDTTEELETEALRMSYLTAPTDPDMIPVRLDTLCNSAALTDPELVSLARSDIRVILARGPELKSAFSEIYGRCSANGKSRLYEIVRSVDANLAASLR